MIGTLARAAVISAAVALGGMAASAPASATMITPSGPHDGEPGLYQIMDSIYGVGNWTQIDAEQSRTYPVGNYDINFQTRYALSDGAFGYVPAGGTSSITLMTMSGAGANVTVNPTSTTLIPGQTGDQFTFTYTNLATGDVFSTDPTKNADGLDHEILFRVFLPGQGPDDFTFVMAWKDTLNLGDHDFNDAVLQLSFTPASVPEPATLAILGTTLLGFGALRFRRKRG